LIEKALKIDPNNGMVQWLAGTAAFQRNDFEKALLHWEILLPQLTTGSEDEQIIQNAIADANARLGKPSAQVVRNAVQAGTGAPAPTKTAATNPKGSVSGTVEIDPALKAKASATDIIMVIARLPGTRVPLAVLRAPAAQVPLKFTLDDSLAMNPQALLSAATQVELEVRISKTGMAMPDSGDLLSSVQTVKVGASGLKLRIDHVRP
jgi:cytochrome c-type biogenesis protein CcmH